jgi:hypothetical protein
MNTRSNRDARKPANILSLQNTRSSVLQDKVFIREFGPVDALASGTVVIGKVPTLAHEIGNDTVKRRLGKAKALFARTESPEVLNSLGDDIGTKLHDNAALYNIYIYIS